MGKTVETDEERENRVKYHTVPQVKVPIGFGKCRNQQMQDAQSQQEQYQLVDPRLWQEYMSFF